MYFGSIGLVAALDLQRQDRVDQRTSARSTPRWSSAPAPRPVLYKDRLYIVNDNTTQSFLIAFDKRTGKEIWKVNRDERGNWSTPIVWENERAHRDRDDRHASRVRSYDLDGKLLWELARHVDADDPVAVRQARTGLHQLGLSGRRAASGLRDSPRGASGDISLKEGETSNEYIAWHQPLLGTYNTSALVYGDYYYTLLDRGFLLCHDARTGKQIYGRQRISVESSGFTTSPWAYNGKIFVLSEDGDTFVDPGRTGVQAAREELARTRCRWPRRPCCAAA